MTELELTQPDDDAAGPFVLTRRECLVYGGLSVLSTLPLISISAPAEAVPAPPPPEQGFRRVYLDK